MIKLVATDLDGTVLREDVTPSARTVQVVGKLLAADVPVAICTARAPRSTVPIARDLGMRSGFAICNSGGTIIDLATEAVVHHHPVDPGQARRMIERLRERVPGIAFSGYVNEGWHREPHYVPGVLLPTPPEMTVGDALEFIAAGPVTKFSVRHADLAVDELHAHVAEAVAEIGMSHAISIAGFIEVLGPGIDKAAGAAWVADALGITAAETIAFGDDRPDIPMLAWAGRGVAVANAHPDVLAIADEVCGSVTEDGVAIVLEELFGDALSSSEDRR